MSRCARPASHSFLTPTCPMWGIGAGAGAGICQVMAWSAMSQKRDRFVT